MLCKIKVVTASARRDIASITQLAEEVAMDLTKCGYTVTESEIAFDRSQGTSHIEVFGERRGAIDSKCNYKHFRVS